jgi:integrase
VPNPLYFARTRPGRSPIIVEPEQAARMLAATAGLTPTAASPLLPAVMRLAIVILYTAGLRRGELLRLTLDDVAPDEGVLRIRSSKFHESRLVPLSPDASDELRAYLRKRLAPPFDARPHDPLLCNIQGGLRGYTGTGLSAGIHRLFKTAGVHNSEGRRPRIHDLRHSFAVQALVRWYREGADVQSNLPKLAMYMGHVSIVSTAYYLHFVPTLAALAGDRFERSFGDLIEEMPA